MCIWQIINDLQAFLDLEKSCFTSLIFVGMKYDGAFIINFLGPVWFLVVLFLAKLETQFLLSNRFGWITITTLAIISMYVTNNYRIVLPFGILQALSSSFFLMVGFYLRRFKILEMKISNYYVIFCALLIIPYLHYFPVATRINSYSFNIVSCIISSSISILFIFICKMLSSQQNKLFDSIIRFLIFLGQNTLLILCIHTLDDEYDWFKIPSYIWYEFLIRSIYIISLVVICKRIPFIKYILNIK